MAAARGSGEFLRDGRERRRGGGGRTSVEGFRESFRGHLGGIRAVVAVFACTFFFGFLKTLQLFEADFCEAEPVLQVSRHLKKGDTVSIHGQNAQISTQMTVVNLPVRCRSSGLPFEQSSAESSALQRV